LKTKLLPTPPSSTKKPAAVTGLERSIHQLAFRRKDLLDLGSSDLGPTRIRVLAAVARHFVPHVSNNSAKKIQESMNSGATFDKWMTASDLALAVLILEHHILHWRTLLLNQLENGSPAILPYSSPQSGGRDQSGLLYKDGIGGEEGKLRFEMLSVYFYRSLCSRDTTAAQLHHAITELVKAHPSSSSFPEANRTEPKIKDVQEWVLHRVFVYMHMKN
jgi:hypothetical protein